MSERRRLSNTFHRPTTESGFRRQRRRAVNEFSARVEALRTELKVALDAQFTAEADEALGEVRTLIRPLTDLVERERDALADLDAQHRTLAAGADRLRADVRDRYGEARVS